MSGHRRGRLHRLQPRGRARGRGTRGPTSLTTSRPARAIQVPCRGRVPPAGHPPRQRARRALISKGARADVDLPPGRPGLCAQGASRSRRFDAEVNVVGTLARAGGGAQGRCARASSPPPAARGLRRVRWGPPRPEAQRLAETRPLSHYGMSKMAAEGYLSASTGGFYGLKYVGPAAREHLRAAAGSARRGRRGRDLLRADARRRPAPRCSATGGRRGTTSTSATSSKAFLAAEKGPVRRGGEHRRAARRSMRPRPAVTASATRATPRWRPRPAWRAAAQRAGPPPRPDGSGGWSASERRWLDGLQADVRLSVARRALVRLPAARPPGAFSPV